MTSGLLEAIKIHASGYEFRESIESFVEKFWPISLQKSDNEGAEDPISGINDYVHKIFRVATKGDPDSPAHHSQNQWAIGVTQVFMKGPCKRMVEQCMLETM